MSKTEEILEAIDIDNVPMSKSELTKWLQENEDKLEDARELWLDLDTSVISAVENPSHDSSFISLKSEDEKVEETPLLMREKGEENEKQIAYAAAMVPDQKDRDGDIVPSPIVEKAAHQYMEELRNNEVDADHETALGSDGAQKKRGTVVESWIIDEAKEFETVEQEVKSYPSKTWMVGIKFEDEVWERIKEGEIEGYSIMGTPRVLDLSETKETLKGSSTNDNSMSDSDTETEQEEKEETEDETYNVSLSKEELTDHLVDEIADQIKEDLPASATPEEGEKETEETETEEESKDGDDSNEDEDDEEKSLEEFAEEKEIKVQDIVGLVSDYFEVETSDVSDALAPFMDDDSSEEDSTEETETEEESDEEKEEQEAEEKSVDEHYSEITRMVTEEKQTSETPTEKSEGDDEDEDPYSNII